MKAITLEKRDKRLKLNYRDYALFPEGGSKRHEIIDGEHYMTPSPTTKHQRISRNMVWIIESFLRENRCGEILSAPFDVILSDNDIVVPDLVYVSRKNIHMLTEENIKGIPDLIIEILSPSHRKRDRILKRDLYEKYGVKEYWLIDPDKEQVEVYTFSGNRFLPPAVYNRDQVIKTGIIPGLEVDIKAIFSFNA